ncbi:MAG: RNB domain-containing ribonuclease [Phycisphaerae bacterium]|nr:RNB domain-containing ribonuclease [Phycisphaerae bacterium]NUQ44953.1 RNB domain-containing ribonuclease [Phycisphaerae bacterium]
MPDRFIQTIVNFLARPDYRPLKLRALARAMEIDEDEYPAFRSAVRSLTDAGRVVAGGGGKLLLPPMPTIVDGVFRGNRRGYGFVTPDPPTGDGDVHVPAGATSGAQSGDIVRCRVRKSGRQDGRMRYVGEVVEILSRAFSRVVGALEKAGDRWIVRPHGTTPLEPVYVDDVSARQVRAGDQVVVEILAYAEEGRPARGVIVERLGPFGGPGVDVLTVIRQYGLPDMFSEEALAEAREAARSYRIEDRLDGRLDLRDELIVTIDPADARDFDDAISLRRIDEGEPPAKSVTALEESDRAAPSTPRDRSRRKPRSRRAAGGPEVGSVAGPLPAAWELGVHIADVSAFVPAGNALDREALERGTSVYFPRHVVPMLPELLSNGVCSLQEGAPRLCKCVFIRYDAEGRVIDARFAESVISSSKRLTYEQVTAVLEGRTADVPEPVIALLRDMERLARIIRSRRLREGMLVLDLPDVELELDDHNRVRDAHPADTSFSHTIIEMFMVEANEAVARRLTEAGAAFLRRVHPEPAAEALENLSLALRGAGMELPRRAERRDLQDLLDTVRGKPAATVVNLLTLKSLAQALYSPRREGHYALASECYCHFTSPIRRYPDLHVHRLLAAVMRGEDVRASAVRYAAGGETDAAANERNAAPACEKQPGRRRRTGTRRGHVRRASRRDNEEARASRRVDRPGSSVSLDAAPTDVTLLGRHCSFTERRAQDAERELKLLKVLELLSDHVGESFEGIVTGVAPFGVFVEHRRYLVDGLVDIADLPDDYWEIDESRSAMRGRRTGRRFRIGDVVRATIAKVDLPGRRLSLVLTESGSEGRHPRGPDVLRRRGRFDSKRRGGRSPGRRGR